MSPNAMHAVLTKRERQIMDRLYRLGRATANEVLDGLPGAPSYSTVRTQLRVLEGKGHVRHESDGLRYVYMPTVPRHSARRSALKHLVETFFDGSNAKIVAALLGGEASKVTDEDLDRILELVRDGTGRVAMTLLLDVVLRSSAILAATLVALPFLRRHSAALRHGVLAGAMAASAIIVPLSWTLPCWTVEVPAALAVPVSEPSGSTGQPETAPCRGRGGPGGSPAPATLLVAVWAVGFALGCRAHRRLVLPAAPRCRARGCRHGWPVESRASPRLSASVGLRRPITLLQTDTPDLLATWGALTPQILLPSRATSGAMRGFTPCSATRSPTSSARTGSCSSPRKRCGPSTGSTPSTGLRVARLRRESEQACDDAVLRLGVPARDYALHLVDVARSCRSSALPVAAVMPMARPSTLERRIAAMLNPSLGRRVPTVRALALTATVLAALSLPVAALPCRARRSATFLRRRL